MKFLLLNFYFLGTALELIYYFTTYKRHQIYTLLYAHKRTHNTNTVKPGTGNQPTRPKSQKQKTHEKTTAT